MIAEQLVETKIDSDIIIEAIKRNEHLLNVADYEKINYVTFGFNSRVILSNNIVFLQALNNDLGGEIIQDNTIGTFLHLK